MGTGTNGTPDNAKGMAPAREGKAERGARRRARTLGYEDGIQTSRDFANFMSSLIGDLISGRIDVKTANACCNAGGKLLRIVELEHKFGRNAAEKGTDRVLTLAGQGA